MLAIGERHDDGFTLIESLVVVAIAALISGLMFPRLQSAVQGQEYRMARSAMLMGVRDARARAIRGGAPVRFAVTGDAAGFRVGSQPAQSLPAAVRLRSRAEGRAITFYTDGTSDGGRLTLSGRGVSQDFIVFPTTGLIFEARQ